MQKNSQFIIQTTKSISPYESRKSIILSYSPAQKWDLSFFLSQATLEELKASYRRLCMLYHPDKHRDPELKSQAEQLFNQVHRAYEGKDTFCKTPTRIKICYFKQISTNLSDFFQKQVIRIKKKLCKTKKVKTQKHLHELNFYFLLSPSVLSDDHSRAIYDIFGKKGLEVEGWEVLMLFNRTFFFVIKFSGFAATLYNVYSVNISSVPISYGNDVV